MSDPIQDVQPHDEAEMLLPWYATGQLEAQDRLVVERHLSSCATCREQLALERRLSREFRGFAPEVDAGWARLRRRMEPGRDRRGPVRERARRRWNVLQNPAVAGLAAAQLALLVLGGSWLVSMNRPSYQALGSAPAPSSADMIVIFRPDATEKDVRAALRSIDASIVDGPTATDAYLLHVPNAKRQQSLQKLQERNEVQLAQPIDGAVK